MLQMEIVDMSHSSKPHSTKLIMTEGEIHPTSAIVIYRMIFPLTQYMQAVSMDTLQKHLCNENTKKALAVITN